MELNVVMHKRHGRQWLVEDLSHSGVIHFHGSK
jgi:hypothetical protein